METILVTGGAGYIGSHTVLELLNKGYNVVVMDNLCNSSKESLRRVEELTGKKVTFYETDIRDAEGTDKIFKAHKIDAVIHFAGLKAVGESCQIPLKYYENNIGGTVTLLEVMQKNNVKKIIFSSSATVYGTPERLPLDENCRLSTTNPYGSTKLMLETVLQDLYKSDNEWNVILLRYFNPVGAHESGRIGEDPEGIPNNLMPYVAQVASGKLKCIRVFGNDYDTPDGTGVRDYIHVVDLALGHIAAIEYCKDAGVHIYNLGTGHGYSVLDMIHAFEKACGKKLPYEICPRRSGDIAACYACSDKAEKELHWKAKYGITADRILIQSVDEADGDVDIPGTPIAQSLHLARKLKEIDPSFRLMQNSLMLYRTPKDTVLKNMRVQAEYFDVFCPLRWNVPRETQDIWRGKELWSYLVLNNNTPPCIYRRMFWLNFRDGMNGVCPFWHMEEHAGGDGFEFFTGWANGIRSNYGGVYADITHGAILTSRRLEAHNLGREDYRLMDFCRRKLAERPDGKMSLELKQIVSEAASGGAMSALDAGRVKLEQLAERLATR